MVSLALACFNAQRNASLRPATNRIAIPGLAWLITFLAVRTPAFRLVWSSVTRCLLSERTRCQSAIERAQNLSELETALVRFIGSGLDRRNLQGMQSAIGALRLSGFRELAVAFESQWTDCTSQQYGPEASIDLSSSRQRFLHLVDRLDSGLRSNRKSDVRPARKLSPPGSKTGRRATATGLLVLTAITLQGFLSSPLLANAVDRQEVSEVQLTAEQQQLVLTEATESYEQAMELIESDRAEANERFAAAVAKYQLLIDAGVHNAQLFQNQGNACFQSGKLGAAIANYERGLALSPMNRQLRTNLDAVVALVESKRAEDSAGTLEERANVLDVVAFFNRALHAAIGSTTVLSLLAVSSILFWGVLYIWVYRPSLPVRFLAIGPLLLMLTSATSLWLASEPPPNAYQAVLVAKQVVLHTGDGEEFDRAAEISNADGLQVKVLQERSGWLQIETAQNQQGWIPAEDAMLF